VKLSPKTEWPYLVLLAGMWVAAAMSWPASPDRIPVHWNLEGQVDRHGGKFEGLILPPLIATACYVLFVLLPRLDRRRAADDRFATVYAILRFVMLVVMAGVYGLMLLGLHRVEFQVGPLVLVLVGISLVALGASMPRFESRGLVGVRTPWTLSGQRSWKKTHDAVGRVFVVMGLLLIAASLARPTMAFWIVIGGILIMTVGLVVYSYRVWRDDPERDASPGS